MAIGNPITLTNNVASKSISVTATASQTLFTVTGGYRINQLHVFRNGVQLSQSLDFVANDGSTVILNTAANANDTILFRVFDDFRIADAISASGSDQVLAGNLTVTGTFTGATIGINSAGTSVGAAKTLNFIGTGNTFLDKGDGTIDVSISGVGAAGTWTNYDGVAGVSTTKKVKIQNNLEVTGAASTFTGNLFVSGTLNYEDVTNIDSVGLVTARSGIKIGPTAGVGGTFAADGSYITAGIITATTFYGSGANLTGVVSGVDIESGGSFLGAGITSINFQQGATVTASGAGTTISISAGITTTQYSPTANAIIQIGLGTAQHHELTLSAGFTTITTSGGNFGESHSLVLIQPSSGIATVGFSTFFLFPSGSTPSMSEGGSKVDLVSFVVKDIAGNAGTGATVLLASAGLNYS